MRLPDHAPTRAEAERDEHQVCDDCPGCWCHDHDEDCDTVVGMTEIAARLDVSIHTVRAWRLYGRLPEPDWQLATGPVWLWATIEEWHDA